MCSRISSKFMILALTKAHALGQSPLIWNSAESKVTLDTTLRFKVISGLVLLGDAGSGAIYILLAILSSADAFNPTFIMLILCIVFFMAHNVVVDLNMMYYAPDAAALVNGFLHVGCTKKGSTFHIPSRDRRRIDGIIEAFYRGILVVVMGFAIIFTTLFYEDMIKLGMLFNQVVGGFVGIVLPKPWMGVISHCNIAYSVYLSYVSTSKWLVYYCCGVPILNCIAVWSSPSWLRGKIECGDQSSFFKIYRVVGIFVDLLNEFFSRPMLSFKFVVVMVFAITLAMFITTPISVHSMFGISLGFCILHVLNYALPLAAQITSSSEDSIRQIRLISRKLHFKWDKCAYNTDKQSKLAQKKEERRVHEQDDMHEPNLTDQMAQQKFRDLKMCAQILSAQRKHEQKLMASLRPYKIYMGSCYAIDRCLTPKILNASFDQTVNMLLIGK